jgi:hypothetical protein
VANILHMFRYAKLGEDGELGRPTGTLAIVDHGDRMSVVDVCEGGGDEGPSKTTYPLISFKLNEPVGWPPGQVATLVCVLGSIPLEKPNDVASGLCRDCSASGRYTHDGWMSCGKYGCAHREERREWSCYRRLPVEAGVSIAGLTAAVSVVPKVKAKER